MASPLDEYRSLPTEGVILPGTRFRLRTVLGQGAQGIAWLADDEQMRRRVVIKAVLDLTAPDVADRFTREERVLAAIRHPSIVTIFEVGILPNLHPFYVMEWLDARPLSAWLKEGHQFSAGQVCSLMAQVCFGLGAAHQEGIVHRDVKPANILLSNDGRQVKLIDFGIAKRIRQTSLQRTVPQTAQGTTLGTPRYVSPEQALSQTLTPASDLYSTGVVLYLLLTGRTPFDGAEYELLLHHVNTPPPTLNDAKCGRTFSSDMEALVGNLLRKNASQRFQSANEVGDLLVELARHEGALLGSEAPAISMRAVHASVVAPSSASSLAERQAESTASLVAPSSEHSQQHRFVASSGDPTGQRPLEATGGLDRDAGGPARERTLDSAPASPSRAAASANSLASAAPQAPIAYSRPEPVTGPVSARAAAPPLVLPGTQMAVGRPVTTARVAAPSPAWGRTSPGSRRRSVIAIVIAAISLVVGAVALIVTFARSPRADPTDTDRRARNDSDEGRDDDVSPKHIASTQLAGDPPSPMTTTAAASAKTLAEAPAPTKSSSISVATSATPPSPRPHSKGVVASAPPTPSTAPVPTPATVPVPSSNVPMDGVPDDRL